MNGDYSDEEGIQKLQKYAEMYGLDAKSGLEVPETTPMCQIRTRHVPPWDSLHICIRRQVWRDM